MRNYLLILSSLLFIACSDDNGFLGKSETADAIANIEATTSSDAEGVESENILANVEDAVENESEAPGETPAGDQPVDAKQPKDDYDDDDDGDDDDDDKDYDSDDDGDDGYDDDDNDDSYDDNDDDDLNEEFSACNDASNFQAIKINGNEGNTTVRTDQFFAAKITGNRSFLNLNVSSEVAGATLNGICLDLRGQESVANINLSMNIEKLQIITRGNSGKVTINIKEGYSISQVLEDQKGKGVVSVNVIPAA